MIISKSLILQISVPLSIPPLFVECPQSFAETALCGALLKYREDLGGVLLSVDGVEVDGEPPISGKVYPESPYTLVTASARCVVFAPRPGHQLRATVTSVASTHIGALVAGTFSATVSEAGFRGAFRCPGGHTWTAVDGSGVKVRVGTRIRIIVDGIRHGDGILTLDCSLAEVLNEKADSAGVVEDNDDMFMEIE